MKNITLLQAIIILLVWNVDALEDFTLCQNEFTLRPKDGLLKKNTFKWLAFVQYIHVTTELPHVTKAPRAVLIQKHFMLGTALDFLRLPKHYKLGKVTFGEYEREETDCGMTLPQLKMGGQCPYAFLETQVKEIIQHPEYSRFGVGNSLVLVKLMRPIKSPYMVPVCLPTLEERAKRKNNKYVFLVDYLSSVPKEFLIERMGKRTVKLYTHKECRRHRMKAKLSSEGVTHVLCSSGCGVRTGSPIVSHNAFGAFEVIGIAAGGSACTSKGNRRRLVQEPPLYIDVYPYKTWIINVITAHELPEAYPTTYRRYFGGATMGIHKKELRQSGSGYYYKPREGWRARTFVSGDMCFSQTKMYARKKYSMFYFETFEVNADPPAKMQYFMKLSAGIYFTITCVQMALPNRYVTPDIRGIPGFNISIRMFTDWFPYSYRYTLSLIGRRAKRSEYKYDQFEYEYGRFAMAGQRVIKNNTPSG